MVSQIIKKMLVQMIQVIIIIFVIIFVIIIYYYFDMFKTSKLINAYSHSFIIPIIYSYSSCNFNFLNLQYFIIFHSFYLYLLCSLILCFIPCICVYLYHLLILEEKEKVLMYLLHCNNYIVMITMIVII